MTLRGKVSGYRSNEMKKFIEKYCNNCGCFLPEERDGSVSTIEPSKLGIPHFAIDKLHSGCKPYEVRVCDARYVPDGNGGCEYYREGRLLPLSRSIGTFHSEPIEALKVK